MISILIFTFYIINQICFRCIIDAYLSFYGLVLDIDMNCGCRLYCSFCQMDLTYAMDCLLNSITGMKFVCCLVHRGSTVGFLLLQCSSGVVRHPRDLQVSVATRFCRVLIFASSQYLSVIYLFHVMIH